MIFARFYDWVSKPDLKQAHAVWSCDDDIAKNGLCGAGGKEYQEWDEEKKKPKCRKCENRLRIIEREEDEDGRSS